MLVRIIARTVKGELALRKYIDDAEAREAAMLKLSKFNPKRIKFDVEQRQAKKIVSEEWFNNPLRIEATILPKFDSHAFMLVPKLENEFKRIMLNSGCGLEDYDLSVVY